MEPVTHVLTGACVARTGLNRRAAYTTAAMAIAAEFPDIDTVWSLRGPVSGFEHHRGITHTFLGLPFEAAVILLSFFLLHRFRAGRRTPGRHTDSEIRRKTEQVAPPRWGPLFGFILLGLLSHLLLDYTNNYGLRPFFPFDDRWYAGSMVFIFDPLLFFFLLTGLCLPWFFGLIGRELGAAKEHFRGRGWARAALVAVLLLWSVRWYEHRQALLTAQSQSLRMPGKVSGNVPLPSSSDTLDPQVNQETALAPLAAEAPRALLQPLRSLASPDPLSVFRWYTATDFGPAYQLGVADTRFGTWTAGQILNKPPPSAALLAAEHSRLGQIYRDWSAMPLCTGSRDAPGDPDESMPEVARTPGTASVRCSDLRFMGDLPWLRRNGAPPLTAEFLLNAQNGVIAQGMDGRYEER